MLKVQRYEPKYKDLWNNFIDNSKNGVFFLNRDYMEYHSDRFKDFSLMFFNKNKLLVVMPANMEGDIVISHAGLTFGGLISNNKMGTSKMLKIFHVLKEFLKEHDIKKIIYKAIPHIYHSIPAEEDLYALFLNNARLIRRDVSSCILKDERINFTRQKRRNIKRCREKGVIVKKDNDFESFMALKEEDLKKKYGKKPVHTANEIELLAERFPDNIKLFTARQNDDLLAGIVIYESKNVAHGQYLASTNYGKMINAPDLITDFLINNYYKNKCYDCGISTENNGHYLNEGLVLFKEGVGARSIIYDFYEMDIK